MTIFQKKALLVWGAGVFAYGAAVFHRSSLGVAGVEAASRFGIGPSMLAMFSVGQLIVYAGMQVPVGILLDRYGSRRLLVAGAALMGVGQLLFALAAHVQLAIVARVLIGLGDAMTFISVIRVVALWFPPRRNPLMVQLTGVIGQLGSLASAVPLVVLLRDAGWTATFLAATGLGVLAVVLVIVVLRDHPYTGEAPPAPPSNAEVRAGLRASWQEPGTRLGLWTHFVTQFSGTVFALLWGYPFLVSGEGLSPATAALLLSMLTVAAIVLGPAIANFCARLPYHRSVLVLAVPASSAVVWAVVLLWPGRAPLWLLAILTLVLAVNGPGSMIGFDYARTFNPASRIGGATGIVNVGGFVAAVALIVGIGAVLQVFTPASAGTNYSLDAFRWAFALQYLLWGIGAVQVVRYRNAARRVMAERDPEAFAALRQGGLVAAAAD
ncbi:MFS transporter [Planosporangium flavigriseum]|uniref:MFS transporter n=1 Tax=Planosporangium flavigriseum TaxID=373681 RepID=A0A8J3M081_9ACTN|nr:MFS transporter [Planosporangium flavigriseum]NJC68025.1 MFS transporter [Planosporangium flavigriseum]GIG76660.1 MFS transporter [Planosporangium flavigriseum]